MCHRQNERKFKEQWYVLRFEWHHSVSLCCGFCHFHHGCLLNDDQLWNGKDKMKRRLVLFIEYQCLIIAIKFSVRSFSAHHLLSHDFASEPDTERWILCIWLSMGKCMPLSRQWNCRFLLFHSLNLLCARFVAFTLFFFIKLATIWIKKIKFYRICATTNRKKMITIQLRKHKHYTFFTVFASDLYAFSV